MPIPVKQFISLADVHSASYLFAVTTRVCSSRVFTDIDKMLHKQGKALDTAFCVEMAENYRRIRSSQITNALAAVYAKIPAFPGKSILTAESHHGIAALIVYFVLLAYIFALLTRYRLREKRRKKGEGTTIRTSAQRI
jgi:hypothetical protein